MKKIIAYIKHNISHKIYFWKWSNLKKKLVKYGPTFLVILILVEIIEHFCLPYLFYYMGSNVHEIFYLLIPAPLLICLHFITAPIIFLIYIKISNRKRQKNDS